MPLRMQQALNVVPPSKERHTEVKIALARRDLALTRGAMSIPWRGSHQALPPSKSKIFTKLFENSKRMFGDPDQKLTCLYDRMILAGRGTPMDKDLLKAPTCCRYHWLQYQTGKQRLIDAVLPYEDLFQPPTPVSKALRNLRKPDQLSRRVWCDLNRNARVQATIATVIVRWHNVRNDPGYDIDSLYATLRPYGEIDNIVQTSPLSARVMFCDLQAACHTVAEHSLGRPDNPLLCLWYHKSMKNKRFYVRRRHLHVSFDPSAT
ncbi:uncharacterized protein LOC110974743 [Acanthaster planci]|uniref:Uncharacterized protein LOC110974743 n=1 Tax=Acanthaster planci TaxID=133434 RepID=A0A8B7XN66_ACAPL|nr:uncharacterized protein LOC110974743 [Acanthaster planci]